MPAIAVNSFPDRNMLSGFAADLLVQSALAAVSERGRFFVALSGGGTPSLLYKLLAGSPYRERLPLEKMIFFWGDERCVPPDDPESSYHQAYLTWFSQVQVPPGNIYRAKGELEPRAAAEDYANQLKSVAEPGLAWPRFDFVLLGLGMDGHTASLFPGSPQTAGLATVAVSERYQDRPAERVSLTPEVFNTARNVVFLVTGPEKSGALAVTLAGERDPLKYPAQRIHPWDGNLWYLVDNAAASLLPAHMPGIIFQHIQ